MNTTGELLTIRAEALEPLFAAWEEPSRHRVRVENANGGFAQARPGRRPSSLTIAQNLRGVVREWRENFYPGASDTSRQLLNHWFGRAHRVGTGDAGFEFRYYFCQREAIETLIYLKEVRRVERLSQLTAEFGGANAEIAGLGITEEEDAWSRYCFKMATGSGKTKAMSLAIVWSYFHSLRESDSTMARHFVVIAPNLTVFERLREDLKPEGGGLDIFDRDPLIPVEWRGDWNLSVILQDEAAGAATGGTLYLTNIHRLFDKSTKRRNQAETYDWMGPTVSKAKALDTGAELRDRITSHSRVMVINDEAHHVWDPDSAWNEAIRYLHDTIQRRTGGELAAQLDFTATPKDNAGNYFKHIVCDTPLGEAVDAGIVKTPLIGRAGNLTEQASDDAAYRYEAHLRLGYQRWVMSRDEWIKSGKKPLLFVMCEDTSAADQITARLNCDEVFKELNGRTINLHTNLKGKIKKVGKQAVFVESEKDISDEDLKALRRLSRELDSDSSPYFCIVSVLMLREGWDVRNVTTIVPLRPYSSKAGILPEQTLGRGLRRMTPSGQANEIVAVVEHEAFARLYREELAQEGLALEIMEVGEVPVTTVSIFPDVRNKDVPALDIFLPRLSPATQTLPVLGAIAEAELKEAFASFKPVPLGAKGTEELKYEGRHLITGEVVEHMKVNLPLLESGVGAISYYERELEYICKVKNTHAVLGPLLQKFFEDMLFSEPCSLFDARLAARIADSDVREHVRAVFVPLVRKKILKTQIRQLAPAPIPLSGWRPFQVTVSDQRPALRSPRTLFNLVPCNRALEVALTELCGRTPDVAAFAKNSGPQCLRIDYLAGESRLAYYAPDFIVRSTSRLHYLVETKGRVDKDVPAKARAAVQWCKSASKPNSKWQYVYLPEGVFQRFHGDRFEELARASAPALHDLINAERYRDELPLFADQVPAEELAHASSTFVSAEILEALPPRMRRAVDEAINLFQFLEKKPGANLAPVFTALLGVLDEAIKTLIRQRLEPKIPKISSEQSAWFEPYLGDVDHKQHRHYNEMARNLKKTLIFKNGISPLGLLRNCLEHAFNDPNRIRGIFESIRGVFDFEGAQSLYAKVGAINEFRNNRVAHQERPLNDPKEAKQALVTWVEGLNLMAAISKAPSVPRE